MYVRCLTSGQNKDSLTGKSLILEFSNMVYLDLIPGISFNINVMRYLPLYNKTLWVSQFLDFIHYDKTCFQLNGKERQNRCFALIGVAWKLFVRSKQLL